MERFKAFTEGKLGSCKECGSGLRKNKKGEVSCGNTSCTEFNEPVEK